MRIAKHRENKKARSMFEVKKYGSASKLTAPKYDIPVITEEFIGLKLRLCFA
jgi:hypothetical protein